MIYFDQLFYKMNRLDRLVLFFMVVYLISMFYSRFLLSIAMICLSILAIAKFVRKESTFKASEFLPFGAMILVFIVTVVSGLNSEDLGSWMRHLRLKVPFLVLPFTFYLLRETIGKYFYHVLIFFILLTVGSSFLVIYDMFLENELVTNIKKGKSLNTPVDHIKYSLFVAFALLTSIILLVEETIPMIRKSRILLVVCAVFLSVLLHLLAVRSGIIVFYISAFVLLLKYAFYTRKLIFLVPLVSLLLAPFIAFQTIPSFKNKVHYTTYDLEMFRSGKGEYYSDSERWYSMSVGLKLFVDSPLMGTGIGDLKNECKEKYKILYNMDNEKYPHNQYLFILAGSGLIGLILFLVGMVYPAFHFRKRLGSLFLTIMIIVLVSFLVENTIERSYGIAFVLFFMLLIMARKSSTYFSEAMASSPQSR